MIFRCNHLYRFGIYKDSDDGQGPLPVLKDPVERMKNLMNRGPGCVILNDKHLDEPCGGIQYER